MLVEKEHVVRILLVGFVSSMTEHLYLGGDTVHGLRENSSEDKSLWWIAERAAIRLGLHSTATFVEGDRVEVDAAEIGMRHDEADREFIGREHKSACAENCLQARHVVQGHDDIEIFMWARLIPE